MFKFSTHKTQLATQKNYFLKFATCKKKLESHNFILNLQNEFATGKIIFQLIKKNLQLKFIFLRTTPILLFHPEISCFEIILA